MKKKIEYLFFGLIYNLKLNILNPSNWGLRLQSENVDDLSPVKVLSIFDFLMKFIIGFLVFVHHIYWNYAQVHLMVTFRNGRNKIGGLYM